MSRCTAPVRGHRTASGAAECPVHGGRGYGYGGGYRPYSYSPPSYYPTGSSGGSRSSGGGSGSSGGSAKPRWSPVGSTAVYTPTEVRALTPVRENVERRALRLDLRDAFLCHAWDDRAGVAKELNDLLESNGVATWFSERDVGLGTSLLREIDRGLARSRIGIVLVTPKFLDRVRGEGSISERELSALLARELLVPVVHETTYEALREVSPLLGSRTGLNTAENTMAEVAVKLAELVALSSNARTT